MKSNFALTKIICYSYSKKCNQITLRMIFLIIFDYFESHLFQLFTMKYLNGHLRLNLA